MNCVAIFVANLWHRRKIAALERACAEIELTLKTLTTEQAHRDEFMAWVGHELRTPMSALLGLNPLLRDRLADCPEDVMMVDHIRSSTEQLLQVVNDMLDFAQLQAGRLKVREDTFLLQSALNEALEPHLAKAQEKGISLVCEALPQPSMKITTDRERLLQLLRHLLDNAIQFTHAGQVQLRVQVINNELRAEVEDTGPGVPRDRQVAIFEGVGLGLSMCDRLVRLMKGRLGVRSVTGEGAVFWFALPVKVASDIQQQAPVTGQPAPTWQAQPLRFLLVDDQALNLMVARLMLNTCFPNAVVTEASSGAQALQILRAESFDLALIDMLMPEMDGLQLTQALRRHFAPPACHLPVLALTASNDPTDLGRCLSAGMNAVLLKPLNEKQVITQISQALTIAFERGR